MFCIGSFGLKLTVQLLEKTENVPWSGGPKLVKISLHLSVFQDSLFACLIGVSHSENGIILTEKHQEIAQVRGSIHRKDRGALRDYMKGARP